jgi:hypothetical protein
MTTQERYVNPCTDFGFKKFFGSEVNKDLTVDFLNEVVLPKGKKSADIRYGSTECCSSFPIQEQAKTGEWNFKLSEIFTVGISDFAFSDDGLSLHGNRQVPKAVRHEVKLKDQKCQVFYDKLTFIYLEMPHFTKTEEELETNYGKCFYVLKHLPYFTERLPKLKERIFQRLLEAAEIAGFTPEERRMYDDSLKSYRDLKNVSDTAFDDGKLEGVRAGKSGGKLEEKVENIIKALKKGKLSVAEIAEDFDTEENFVLKIKQEHNS